MNGKQLRGTTVAGRQQARVRLITVGVVEQRLRLPQVLVAEKHSEAVAMLQVFELVDVVGRVVSLDALGRQPALAARRLESKVNYVLTLRQNQRELDGCRCYYNPAPRNHLALTLLQRNNTVMSLRRKREKVARDDTFLCHALAQLG